MDLNRRLLLAAAAGAVAPLPALAQHARRPRRGAAPPVEVGEPAMTPFGARGTAAKWAFVVDFNTGAVLLDKEADVPMPPSSMTKLMTAYITYGKLKAGEISLTQEYTVSQRAVDAANGGSKMFAQINTSIPVEALILGMIVQSGNDACVVLAEGISGSESQFVDLMNKKAAELGLTNTTFRNCTGLPDPAQRMSCRDIATLAHRLITDFPEQYRYDRLKEYTWNKITQPNRNPLVQSGKADGLKTGHTNEGGYGLVASAERAGRRIILVANGMTSMKQRAEESDRLLEWAFSDWENVTLFTAGDTVESAKVWLGNRPTVPLVGGRDLVLTMPHGWRANAKITVAYPSPVPAPISRGELLGKLMVSGQNVPVMEVPLLAGADVDRLGLPGRAVAVLSRYVTGG